MKIEISIPDSIIKKADAAAKLLGISRNQLYARAVECYLEARLNSDVTKRLNEFYGSENSELDPILNAMQLASLPDEHW